MDFKNNITIICVDDGSTDNSAKIIQKYQKKFPENIVYLHKENSGQASARNLGIKWLQEKLGYTECFGFSSLRGEAIHNQANQTMKSLKVRFCIMDLRSVRHEILANLSQ